MEKFETFPENMKTAIRVLKDLNGTPFEMAMPLVLGVMNSCVHQRYNVDTMGQYGIVPISLYQMIVAASGLKKSTNYKVAMVGLEEFEKRRFDELANDHLRAEAAEAVYKKKKYSYIKSVEEGNPLPMPDAPRPAETAVYHVSKTTYLGAVSQLNSQPFITLASSEAGDFFTGHAFQGGKTDPQRAMEMVSGLTKFWDGQSITHKTKDKDFSLIDRRVNMIFTLQENMARPILRNRAFTEQGFTNRVLFSQCPVYKSPKMDFSPEAVKRKKDLRDEIEVFHDRVRELCNIPVLYRDEPKHYYELELAVITQSSTAAELIGNWLNEYNDGDRSDDVRLKNYLGFKNRIHEMCIRIAATLAAWNGTQEVTVDDAIAAIDIMEFYIDQRYTIDVGTTDIEEDHTQDVKNLTEWLQERQWIGTMTKLRQYGPNWFRNLGAEQRERLVRDAMRNGDLEVEETHGTTGKRLIVLRVVDHAPENVKIVASSAEFPSNSVASVDPTVATPSEAISN